MRPTLHAMVCIAFLSACSSPTSTTTDRYPSNPDFDKNLQEATRECPMVGPIMDYQNCVYNKTRPIWVHYDEGTLDQFDEMWSKRIDLVKMCIAGTVSWKELDKMMSDINRHYLIKITDERNRNSEQNPSQTTSNNTDQHWGISFLEGLVSIAADYGQGYSSVRANSAPPDQSVYLQEQQLELQRNQIQNQQFVNYQNQLKQNQENEDCRIRRIGNQNAPCP